MKDVRELARRVVGPFDRHCSAAGGQSTDCYVTTPLIGTGVARAECPHGGPQILDHIVAFDRAEGSSANITQTNLVAVSSFSGPRGLLLGYDILRQPLARHPLVDPGRHGGAWDLEPLMAATRALYGTVPEKRFPILPGQHVLCAYKTITRAGPCLIYGALAVGIARDRQGDADLFMEDLGTLQEGCGGTAAPGQESAVLERLVDAVRRIGENLGVRYEKVLLGLRSRRVLAGEVGCAITAAPYVHLARRAVPYGTTEALLHVSLREWEEATGEYFLSADPCPRSLLSSTMSA